LPTVQGFNINKSLFVGDNQLLVALGAQLLLRFDVTLGYTGYYESHSNSTITDVVSVGEGLVALAGKTMVDKTGLGSESNERTIIDATDECCIEIINLQTNSLVCKFVKTN
jgi:hypothetical protein